ncbi:hypothetical protein PR048_012396 [Dryococelus australis]|uniref:Uncharacterized protein n=1 Tax=Dryococelus australis TaxID=614101 RepID=A0ABQ9HP99_9NEOP|nr:hypothetical protein PR048_012396 [Dryococelus australis]
MPHATSRSTVSSDSYDETVNAKGGMNVVQSVCAERSEASIDDDYDDSDSVEEDDYSLDCPTHFPNEFPSTSDVKKAEDVEYTDYLFPEDPNELVYRLDILIDKQKRGDYSTTKERHPTSPWIGVKIVNDWVVWWGMVGMFGERLSGLMKIGEERGVLSPVDKQAVEKESYLPQGGRIPRRGGQGSDEEKEKNMERSRDSKILGVPVPGSYGIRRVFPCKSTICLEACRAGLINCYPNAKWLDYSPPTMANWVQFQVGSLPDFQKRESCRTIPLVRSTEAEQLVCSPPTKANRVQSPAGYLPDFCMWESCRTMPLVSGFSRKSPVSRALSLRRCSILISFHPHRLSRPR